MGFFLRKGLKTAWEKEKMLVISIFSFPQDVFKRNYPLVVLQEVRNEKGNPPAAIQLLLTLILRNLWHETSEPIINTKILLFQRYF